LIFINKGSSCNTDQSTGTSQLLSFKGFSVFVPLIIVLPLLHIHLSRWDIPDYAENVHTVGIAVTGFTSGLALRHSKSNLIFKSTPPQWHNSH
jgi:hypothetical protein